MEPQWLESVHSDGSADYVSCLHPTLGQTVAVRVSFYDTAPVDHVLLRSIPNGAEVLTEARLLEKRDGLCWYEAPLVMEEARMQYQFYLVSGDKVWFYTQNGLTDYMPDHTYDFVLLCGNTQPDWVRDQVFYQIFPERFCNGDPGNDPRPGEYTIDGHGPILREHWEDVPLPYDEGFCMDFHGGDLAGIRQKIPYLKALGVTAVYLNPIFTAPSVHKYDCVDYLHVDPHFGGDEALADLSRALHENGMKLILDISINHTGTAHRWFNRDGLFYPTSEGAWHNPDSVERGYYFFRPDGSYKGWFGFDHMPTLNYTSQSLREAVYRGQDSVLRKWLKPPYSIDGWRFDVADVFARNGEIQLAKELWPEIRQAIREENPEAYILAEDWGDCAQYLQGDMWDSPMNYYGCGRPIRQFFGQVDHFWGRSPVLRQIHATLDAAGLQARIRQHLAKLPWSVQQCQFNLYDSHDIQRLHNDPAILPANWKAATMLQFVLPGCPSVYYGDEAHIDGRLDSIEGCRYPMPWSRDYQGGESYRLIRALARLKREHPALREGGFRFLAAQGGTLAMARCCGSDKLVCVITKDPGPVKLRLPLGVLGAKRPRGLQDLLGTPLRYRPLDSRCVELSVTNGESLLFQVL